MRTRKYIEYVVEMARILTHGVDKNVESREFIKKNVEREWKNLRRGLKPLQETRRNIVDIFYTVFPEFRIENFLLSFEEFFTRDEENQNLKKHPETQKLIEYTKDSPASTGENAVRNSKKSKKRKRDIECTEKLEDYNVLEAQDYNCRVFKQRRNHFKPRKKRHLASDKTVVVENDADDDRQEEHKDRVWPRMENEARNQSQCTARVLRTIIRHIIEKNGLKYYNQNVPEFIDMAVRIRLKNMFEDLKTLLNIRRKNRENHFKATEDKRVSILLTIEREAEEVHLLRMRDQRKAMRKLVNPEETKTRNQTQKHSDFQDSVEIKKTVGKKERLKMERLKFLETKKSEFMQKYVEGKAKMIRNISRRRPLSNLHLPTEHMRKTASVDEGRENCSNLDIKKKLLHLPGLVTSENIRQIQSVKSTKKFVRDSNFVKKTMTLPDCDLLMEFDRDLRKSSLRFRWMTRIPDL
ncbi:unnamed protein product [Agarophyton chilense]